MRPEQPILAATTDESVCRCLALVRGVLPAMIPVVTELADLYIQMHRMAKATGLVKSGDEVVATAGFPLGKAGASNIIKVEVVP